MYEFHSLITFNPLLKIILVLPCNTHYRPTPQLSWEILRGSLPYPTAQAKDSNGFSERLLDEMAIPEAQRRAVTIHVYSDWSRLVIFVTNFENPFEAGSMNQTIENETTCVLWHYSCPRENQGQLSTHSIGASRVYAGLLKTPKKLQQAKHRHLRRSANTSPVLGSRSSHMELNLEEE